MQTSYYEMIGALIGLARATDGNPHLITPDAIDVAKECLSANQANSDHFKRLEKIEQVKRVMVPDCFLCANPCSRTSSFDFSALDHELQSVKDRKLHILQLLQQFSCLENIDTHAEFLFQGLVAIGLEDPLDEVLDTVASNIKQFL